MQTRLRPAESAIIAQLQSGLRCSRAAARCLAVRGVTSAADAQSFIDPRIGALRAPVGLAGLIGAVERIARAIETRERIGVFGDYDVDGVTTAALLTEFLRACGAEVVPAVASREAGYGFTPSAAVALAEQGVTLAITGDCGTSDVPSVELAAARGIDTVIIDHHTVPAAGTAHPAHSLVNPFRADSQFPFRGMASVGLAFYVAGAVRTALRERGFFANRPMPDVRELLDLVALGTVADLVPLTAENRILTAHGLRRLDARARPGVAALLDAAGVNRDRAIDTTSIAWKLAPRLNAPGRLGAAEPSLQLLLAKGAAATDFAQQLEVANSERRQIQERVLAEALAQIEQTEVGAAIVVAGEGWAPGVVGIVAAKLVETYHRPAFVIAVDPATGTGRGSARTTAGVHLYDALHEAAPCLDRYGGHAAAAGFTVRRERVSELAEALGGVCARFAAGSGPVSSVRDIDAEVRLAEVDERLAEELAKMGPFGQANPAPTLLVRGVRVSAVRRVADGAHLKLTVEDGPTSRSAIAFRMGARAVEHGDRIDVAFAPTISTWSGRPTVELEVVDFAAAPNGEAAGSPA